MAELPGYWSAANGIIDDYTNPRNYSMKPTANGGVEYFFKGSPVTNKVYQKGTGLNTSVIEADARKQYAASRPATIGGNDSPVTNDSPVYGSYTGGGSAASQYSAADEQAAYDDQIRALEQLLGYTNTQRDAGLASMIDRFNSEKRTLDDQRARAMEGYRVKETENAQAKERGLGEVDSFANSSYRNLQRLLQGGNAGSSSVARELMPYLVSKAATTRRTGVFDTSGQNARNIDMAKGDAEYQYGMNVQDLENNRKSSEQAFRENILNKQNELGGSLRDLQIKRAMANGKGYAAARAAGDAAQAGITDRQNQLASLFGQYKPTFTAKAMNTKTPELGKYTVDQAAINNSDKNLPAESSYYQTMLKKKQELGY